MLRQHDIALMSWPSHDEKPVVKFAIAYNKDCIFLKYYVTEKSIQAKYRRINDPVYKDSCVEFFISFRGEKEYYNLEFNCLGTGCVGFGANRDDRKLLPYETVSKIRHKAALKVSNYNNPMKSWELTLAIPAGVFSEHSLTNFEGEISRANFYKCGDELPHPHYLSWNSITAPEPNFHLPEFFGEMEFMHAAS